MTRTRQGTDLIVRSPRLLIVLMVVLAAGMTSSARAQDAGADSQEPTTRPTAQTHPNNPELWDVDQMMEDAVFQIARRYNLNPAQTEYTRLLLRQRVLAFLDQHEPEVRELLRESIDLRTGKKAGSPEAYRDWAIRALPIYEAAQAAIFEGNEEWREVLNDEQRKTHDADLTAMRINFDQVTKMLNTWKEGQNPAQVATAQTGTGVSGGGEMASHQGQVSNPPQAVVRKNPEDNWDAYVNLFIKTFQLDEKQSIAAREKILKEIRRDAVKYRERKKDEFELLTDGGDPDGPRLTPLQIRRMREELERPIQRLFVTLDRRLRALPTSKQLAGADPAGEKQLEMMQRMFSGQKSGEAENDDQKGKSAGRAISKPEPKNDAADGKPAGGNGDAASDASSDKQPEKADTKPGEPNR